MLGLEIALLIGGAIIFIVSFLIPVKQKEASEDVKGMIEAEVKKKVGEEIDGLRNHIDDVVDETVTYAQEKTERSLERITNEKIMAVNEYSDTVLDEINKNHQEVMFLYDMLNDKQENLKDAVSEANQAAKSAHENAAKASEAAEVAKETATKVNEATEVAMETVSMVNEAAEEQTFKALTPTATVPVENTISMNKVRTLKWAAFAQEQADEMLETNPEAFADDDRDVVKELEEYFAGADEAASQNALHNEIITLHKLGQSDVEIAKSLNMGVGEVALIIGLHSK